MEEVRLEQDLRRAAYEMGGEFHLGRTGEGAWLATFRKYSVPAAQAPQGAILMSAESPDRRQAMVGLINAWRSSR